ncbi:hypothetical protein EJ06DRAFT_528510 [Trichodelitschia bisporula]|uniref:DNA polymerase epsilon subunit B n=1 Tax=Trichodelitschia bisporula TaxID=703511 RepID=A0A6G1I2J4_9PEZI|nr:hypothetical protein EJ06DRAFT_528510 [Trichodelitschia bisporula]
MPPKDRLSHLLPSDSAAPSSSPAFATPLPLPPRRTAAIPAPPLLKPRAIAPIELPAQTLRPVAFRTFTKKHNLTLTSAALGALASFIGRHCGGGWREEGLAEGVLEEVAKMWKREGGSVIVEGDGPMMKGILKTLESSMVNGRVQSAKSSLSRSTSFDFRSVDSHEDSPAPDTSFGFSNLDVRDKVASDEDDDDALQDPREWLKLVDAFSQPRLVYNAAKKHFEKAANKPSLFPPPSSRTDYFRHRYALTHARIMRHTSFTPTSDPNTAGPPKITPIANLLGRTNSPHLLLGLLSPLPTGHPALSDPTGTITLNLDHCAPHPRDGAYFTPGMLVLLDGLYTEDAATSTLGQTTGIGGTIPGTFIASLIAHPPPERRSHTLGLPDPSQENPPQPAFPWTDFHGLGSTRGTSARMLRLQTRLFAPPAPFAPRTRIALASSVALDDPRSLSALRALLTHYDQAPPLAIVLLGSFASVPALSGAAVDAAAYDAAWAALAGLLADFESLLARTTLVFVPGEGDAWGGAGSGGTIPRERVPSEFVERIEAVVREANRAALREDDEGPRGREGEVLFASNPARLSWFGVVGEAVLYRDDVAGRMRRNAIRFNDAEAEGEGDEGDDEPVEDEEEVDSDTLAARRLTRSLLDQAHLAPFAPATRPVLWDYAAALQLYPLPSVLCIADAEEPAFALNYTGCCVVNPGKLADGRRRARWVEVDVVALRGEVREEGEG